MNPSSRHPPHHHFSTSSRSSYPPTTLYTPLCVPRHVVSHTLVIQKSLDASNGADRDVLIPQLPLGKAHDLLLRDLRDDTLDLLRAHAAAGSDDLAADVLGDGGRAVQREEDGSLELGLGTLNLGLGDVVGEAGPLAEGEVDEVVQAGEVVGDEVDSPETNTG